MLFVYVKLKFDLPRARTENAKLCLWNQYVRFFPWGMVSRRLLTCFGPNNLGFGQVISFEYEEGRACYGIETYVGSRPDVSMKFLRTWCLAKVN